MVKSRERENEYVMSNIIPKIIYLSNKLNYLYKYCQRDVSRYYRSGILWKQGIDDTSQATKEFEENNF